MPSTGVSVADAAARLGVDESRVRQMLRAGQLSGERFGSMWLVDAAAVSRRARRVPVPGRPLSPVRAWALLDLVGGGAAAWVSPQGRSQVRSLARRLQGAGPDRWEAALRGRSVVRSCRAHPSAVSRLLADPVVLRAGAQEAARVGLDLVAVDAVPEVYVREGDWPALQVSLRLREVVAEPVVLVRVPQGVWPFRERPAGAAALAADLLGSEEPRARSAGVAWLNEHVARAWAR